MRFYGNCLARAGLTKRVFGCILTLTNKSTPKGVFLFQHIMKYLLLLSVLAASQPFGMTPPDEVAKVAPLVEVYQVASQATALVATNRLKTPQSNAPKKSFPVVITGYSSEPGQTDDTPYITASGAYVREGVAAANFLPLGTAFRIPKLFGDRVFIVKDRMNKRYDERVDIWFAETSHAKRFGIKTAMIEVL